MEKSEFETNAEALITAGQAADLTTAMGLVAARDPEAYGRYLQTLSKPGTGARIIPPSKPSGDFETCAKILVSTGEARDINHGLEIMGSVEGAYERYLKSLS